MKTMPKFYNIGSDPEYVFVSRREFRPIMTPANSIITNNGTALQAFIGTDGHAAVGEMRPGPASNVARHIYDIAYGLHHIDRWLTNSTRFNHVKVSAQPFVTEKPLGGHIHCSFFLDELGITAANRMFNGERFVVRNTQLPAPALTLEQLASAGEYARRYHNNELFNILDFISIADHLVLIYEMAIQPWWDRVRRNARYGGINGVGERCRQYFSIPTGSKADKFVYAHYEYRVPSTWLCHPWLAYAYLGLMKLAILNAGRIMEQLTSFQENIVAAPNGEPANEAYRSLFMTRFQDLVKHGRWTNDIKGLKEIIPKTFDARAAWFEIPGQPVDIDAWRQLL